MPCFSQLCISVEGRHFLMSSMSRNDKVTYLSWEVRICEEKTGFKSKIITLETSNNPSHQFNHAGSPSVLLYIEKRNIESKVVSKSPLFIHKFLKSFLSHESTIESLIPCQQS